MFPEGLVLYVLIAIDLSFKAYDFPDTYIVVWIYAHLALAFLVTLNVILYFMYRGVTCLRSLLGKTLFTLVLAVNVMNILGLYLALRDLMQESQLDNSDFFEFLSLEVLALVIYGIAFYVIISKIIKRKIIATQNDKQRAILDSLYQDSGNPGCAKLSTMLSTHRTLLITFPLTASEKDLLLAHFTVKINEPNDDVCGICLNSFESDSLTSSIGCKHQYHFECLISWFEVKPNCPVCKVGFREPLLDFYHSDFRKKAHNFIGL